MFLLLRVAHISMLLVLFVLTRDTVGTGGTENESLQPSKIKTKNLLFFNDQCLFAEVDC